MAASPETMEKYRKGLKKTAKWASAGSKAFNLAVDETGAELQGQTLPPTPQSINITIQGALRQFLDGQINNPEIIESFKQANCDMTNIRKWLTEQVLARAIPDMIAKGDIAALTNLAKLAGETLEGGNSSTVVVQVADAQQVALANAHIDTIIQPGKN